MNFGVSDFNWLVLFIVLEAPFYASPLKNIKNELQ